VNHGRYSIGMALTDALDDLISEGRIAPQLAMKILSNFDRSITDTLAERVKTNLTFKVCFFFSFFSFVLYPLRVSLVGNAVV
jgi:hypothetical protein